MNKNETYEYLKKHDVRFEITEHRAVYHMGELTDVDWPYPEGNAKNLFIRDDKKRNYYLLTVQGDKRIDLKKFRQQHGTRPLSFASADDLFSLLKLTPGSVTPLGLLCDEERKVQLFLDRDLLLPPAMTGVHPNDNTATVWIRTTDLIRLIREHGNPVETVSFD